MSDLIDRQAAIDAVHEEFDECLVWDESGKCTADEVEIILESLPSAQQEIIRCGECKWYDESHHLDEYEWADEWCLAWSGKTGIDQFCSFGERRTDE